MAISYDITRTFRRVGEEISKAETVSGGAEQNIDESIPDESTDLEVAFVADVSQIKALYVVSDQDITVETNDGTTPDDTLTLEADKPLLWTELDAAAGRPLLTDVTALFVTNASGAAATLRIRCLLDPTA